jgi:hypothetical protein
MGKSEYPMHRLWRLRKQNLVVDAEMRDEGTLGVEIAFLYNGELTYRRRWPTRDAAIAEATAKRSELEREGWMLHW